MFYCVVIYSETVVFKTMEIRLCVKAQNFNSFLVHQIISR